MFSILKPQNYEAQQWNSPGIGGQSHCEGKNDKILASRSRFPPSPQSTNLKDLFQSPELKVQ